MEYCANCKCETPSIGDTIEKRGKNIYHGELTLLLLLLASLKNCFL